MHVLITGGAGYIGSFMTRRLLDEGYQVVVVDSLERGNEGYIDTRATFLKGDLLDKEFVKHIFEQNSFDGVIHFAGYISVGESTHHPFLYFQNNVFSVMNLVEGMQKNHVNNFIFSSTAGIYGNPKTIPIPEDHEKHPESPYGESKLMAEKILSWYQKLGINYMCLRYSNASGASLDGAYGENHNPETHIIPNAMKAALTNQPFTLFGDDYKTEDGTCVRDYIHVLDLVEAHILGLKKLQKDGGGYTYNVGTGKGYSNMQVLDIVKKVTNSDFPVTIEKRRTGDADILIADATKIKNELHFAPKFSDLETIAESAYKWHKKQHS
jgi:UDP-glucose 4-epimerase